MASCPMIFMGLALVHFQKYWLLRLENRLFRLQTFESSTLNIRVTFHEMKWIFSPFHQILVIFQLNVISLSQGYSNGYNLDGPSDSCQFCENNQRSLDFGTYGIIFLNSLNLTTNLNCYLLVAAV